MAISVRQLFDIWTTLLSDKLVPTMEQWGVWLERFTPEEIAHALFVTAEKHERSGLYTLGDENIEQAMVRYASGVMYGRRRPVVEPIGRSQHGG